MGFMPQPLPIFYTKPGCPWCTEALAFFESQGVKLDVRDVLANMHEMRQLVALTGQSKCPSLRYGDFIVADFSVEEFKAKARKHPAVCRELGLQV
jgi:glutaredoxin